MPNRIAPKLLAEFIGTFAFVFIGAGSVAPLAIGMTLTLNILMGGALTGAAFNPARALGPMVAADNYRDVWLYPTAPVVGAVVAAIAHMGLARLAQEQTVMSEPGVAGRTAAE